MNQGKYVFAQVVVYAKFSPYPVVPVINCFMKKTPIAGYCFLFFFFTLLCCTTIKNVTGVDLQNAGINSSLFNDVIKQPQPISTGFANAAKTQVLPDDFGNDRQARNLSELRRTANGAFILRPGFYETYCKSFCLHAGTLAPSKGDGYLYAPLLGTRSNIIHSILSKSAQNPSIKQTDVQYLIWAILARANFKQLSPELRIVAAQLLNTKELFELNGGILGVVPDKLMAEWKKNLSAPLQQALDAENKIRAMFASGLSTYQACQDLAIIPGNALVDNPEYKRGRWSHHPDGYYIRFFPEGYQRTKVQVYFLPPSGSSTIITNVSFTNTHVRAAAIRPVIDLSSIVAVPANTGAQRLALSPPPVDEVDDNYVRKKLPDCFKTAMVNLGRNLDTVVWFFRDYHNVRSGKQFFNDADEIIENNPHGLNECDVYALWGYTTRLFYRELNRWLREGSHRDETREITRLINNALDKLPNYSKPNVYRGVEIREDQLQEFLRDYRAGRRNVWDGFISCGGTLDGSFAGRPRVNIIFEITHLTGKDISELADGVRYGGMEPPEVMIREGRNFESVADPVFDETRGKWIIRVRQLN